MGIIVVLIALVFLKVKRLKFLKGIFFLLAFLIPEFSQGTHLVGGFMSYRYVGQNGSFTTYRVRLYVYRDCTKDGTQNEVPFDDYITLCVYNRANNRFVEDYTIELLSETAVDPVGNTTCPELANACLKRGIYDGQIQVPNSNVGYKLKWERCCRNTQNNLRDDVNGDPYQGQTYYAEIPATALKNSSPEFQDVPVPFICAKDTTVVRNRAVDANNDSLTYRFVTPWQGASTTNPFPEICASVLPGFQNVEYKSGYNSSIPFGTGGVNSIDPLNGLTTYYAPSSGRYAIAIEVTEWRAGVPISTIRLDLQILVIDCKPNNKPRLSYQGGTNVWTVEAGEQICRDVTAIDDKDNQDRVTIRGYSDLFTGANGFTGTKATMTPAPATGIKQVTTRFCWKTDCDHASSDPYVVTFEAYDDGCPSKFINENVLIYVRPFAPPETPAGPQNACQNERKVYQINNQVAGNTYRWSVEGGTIVGDSTLNTLTVDWGTGVSGLVKLWIISKFGCEVGPRTLAVNLVPAPSKPSISGTDTVCLNVSASYSSTADGGVTYKWTSVGGTILGSSQSASANVLWNTEGDGYLVLTVTNSFGCAGPSDTFKVFVSHPKTAPITGPISICPNNKDIEYEVIPSTPGSVYRWFVSGGIQSSGGMSSKVTIDWYGPGTGVLKVVELNRFGCPGDTVTLLITKGHALAGQLPQGDTSICAGTRGVVYSVNPVNGETYFWSISGGTIVSGQGTSSVTVDWGMAGVGNIGVQTSAYDSIAKLPCLSAVRVRTVNIRPVPGRIPVLGNFRVCQQTIGGTFTLAGFPGSTYDWQVTGRTFSGQGSNTITINLDTFGLFPIRVRETSQYGCVGPWNDTILEIKPKPRTTPISGQSVICMPNISNYSYSVTGFAGSSFEWWIDGGSLLNGQGTDQVTADWNGQQYSNIKVQETSDFGCKGDTIRLDVFIDNPSINSRLVTVNPPPGSDQEVLVYYQLLNAPRYNHQVVIQRRMRGSSTAFGTIGTASPSGTLYVDKTAIPDSMSYEYRAVAINLCGDSIYSNQNTDILLKAKKTGPFQYQLSFTDYTGWTVDKYELYRLLENKTDYQVIDVLSAPSVLDYDNGKEHYGMWFRVKAVESGGQARESWSNDVKVYFEPLIFIPNAFTPDKNSTNDRFLPNSGGMKTYKMRIYNRWGEKLFETENNEVGWNGEYLNKEVPSGVYVYVIDYTDYRNRSYQAKGTLHLLR